MVDFESAAGLLSVFHGTLDIPQLKALHDASMVGLKAINDEAVEILAAKAAEDKKAADELAARNMREAMASGPAVRRTVAGLLGPAERGDDK